MDEAQDLDALSPLRLDKLSPLFLFIDTIKEFFLIILLALFASRSSSWELWAVGFSAIFVLFRMISFRFFKYWILPTELVVKSGVIFRQERHIPYERVQNINQTQGILHRLFGVSKVQLESASGTQAEAVFNVISKAAVAELIRASKGQFKTPLKSDDTVAVPEILASQGNTLLKMDIGDVIKHGLITNQGLLPVVILIGFIAQQGDLFESILGPWILANVPLLSNLESINPIDFPVIFILAVLGLLLFALICFWILSIAVSLFRFFNFTLVKSDRKIQSEMGLLTRQTASASLQRIQKITIRETLLHRVFRQVSINCKTAGNTRDSNNLSKSFHYLAPVLGKNRMEEFLNGLELDFNWSLLDPESDLWTPIPYRAWRRMVKVPLFLCLLGIVFSIIAANWSALLFTVLSILVIINAQKSARAMQYIYADKFVAYRSGWISRKISIVLIEKAQVVSLRQNPFDRRRNMAKLAVDTAGFSINDHNINIPYLEYSDAMQLQNEISKEVNLLEFEW